MTIKPRFDYKRTHVYIVTAVGMNFKAVYCINQLFKYFVISNILMKIEHVRF